MNKPNKKILLGLYCVLNSKQFDIYYRSINGSHTINAYELENMYFPNLNILENIGNSISENFLDSEICTKIFAEYLD